MCNFHFFWVPNALVSFQHILLGFKPSYLCVSIRDGYLYPSALPDLESKILEGSIHVWDLWGQKQQKIRSRKDFWWNAIWKLMEKEANVKQNRSEEEESHLRVNSFTKRSQHIRSSIQHHQTDNLLHFHSALGTCAHMITPDSHNEKSWEVGWARELCSCSAAGENEAQRRDLPSWVRDPVDSENITSANNLLYNADSNVYLMLVPLELWK